MGNILTVPSVASLSLCRLPIWVEQADAEGWGSARGQRQKLANLNHTDGSKVSS